MSTPDDHELPPGDGLFPIRHVCAETGINPVTLRAWERRYGLIRPLRTPKGHRLYSAEDIARIRRILTLLDDGVAVSQVGRVLQHETGTARGNGKDLPREPATRTAARSTIGGGLAPHVADPITETLLDTTRELSTVQLERVYARLVMRHGWLGVHERAFLDTYAALREAARHEPADEARLAVFSAWATNTLNDQLRAALLLCEGPTCPCLIIGSGHRRLGGLLFLLASARQGLRVLPMQDVVSAQAMDILTRRFGSRAIVIHTPSGSMPGNERDRLHRLLTAEGVPAYLSGGGAGALAGLETRRRLVTLPRNPLEAADTLSRQLLEALGH